MRSWSILSHSLTLLLYKYQFPLSGFGGEGGAGLFGKPPPPPVKHNIRDQSFGPPAGWSIQHPPYILYILSPPPFLHHITSSDSFLHLLTPSIFSSHMRIYSTIYDTPCRHPSRSSHPCGPPPTPPPVNTIPSLIHCTIYITPAGTPLGPPIPVGPPVLATVLPTRVLPPIVVQVLHIHKYVLSTTHLHTCTHAQHISYP